MLTLGTAQFGMKYGINNTNGIPNNNIANEILKLFNSFNFTYIDTAFNYGKSQKKLGNYDLKNFKIISKINNFNSINDLEAKFDICLKELGVNKLYGILAHSADEIINDREKWNLFLQLKEKQKNLKLGISIYNTNELDFFISNNLVPEIIQLPFNLFDIEFLKYKDYFHENKIEVFVRSVFLQGIIFMEENMLPEKLKIFKTKISKLKNICNKHKISLEEASLGFVLKYSFIKSVIIGVETPEQLLLNIRASKVILSEECLQDLENFANSEPLFLNKVNRWKN